MNTPRYWDIKALVRRYMTNMAKMDFNCFALNKEKARYLENTVLDALRDCLGYNRSEARYGTIRAVKDISMNILLRYYTPDEYEEYACVVVRTAFYVLHVRLWEKYIEGVTCESD